MKMLVLFMLAALVARSYQAPSAAQVVELYIIVDPAAFSRYVHLSTAEDPKADAEAQVRADVDYFVTELNQIYATLAADGLTLELRIRQLDILDADVFPGPDIIMSDALDQLDSWLKAQGSYAALGYDHAMMWTGYNLQGADGSDSVSGYAHVGAICDADYSSSVTEFDSTAQSVLVAAHELGHGLGTGHDAVRNGYVMASANDITADNRGIFSSDSAANILETIGKLETNCLLETNPDSTAPNVPAPAALADPDNLCQRFQNRSDSYMAKNAFYYSNSKPHGDILCQAVQCTYPGAQGWVYSAYTSDGTVCGVNKKCEGGKCVDSPSPDAENFDDSCPFGDEKYIDFQGLSFQGTCGDLIETQGKGVCKKDYVLSACCVSCPAAASGIEGCPYGDSNPQCTNYDQAIICPSNAALCCEHCNGFTAKRDIGAQVKKRFDDMA